MEADFAVELGVDDETLELPWAADDGGPRYYDLKRQPELLLNIEEASRVPELAEFLVVMNSAASILETAKCDTWSSTEINPEEEIFGAAYKFGSYVDILFSQATLRCSFAEHEQFAKRVTQLLKRVPELTFMFDESIAGQDRIEQLLNEIRANEPAGTPTLHERPDGPDDDERDED